MLPVAFPSVNETFWWRPWRTYALTVVPRWFDHGFHEFVNLGRGIISYSIDTRRLFRNKQRRFELVRWTGEITEGTGIGKALHVQPQTTLTNPTSGTISGVLRNCCIIKDMMKCFFSRVLWTRTSQKSTLLWVEGSDASTRIPNPTRNSRECSRCRDIQFATTKHALFQKTKRRGWKLR
jgi:hypothetical protein